MRPLAKQLLPPAGRRHTRGRRKPERPHVCLGAMARFLAWGAGVALLAISGIGVGADFDVGRVTLRVSDEGWTSAGTTGDELAYGGQLSGAIEVAKRSLLLLDGGNRLRAALLVSAARGVPAIHLQWPDDCRSQDNVYAIDARQRSGDTRDCLRVTGLASIERSLATDAPAAAEALALRKTVVPNAGYVVLVEVALDNGTFVAVEALIAADVELGGGAIAQQTLPAGINAELIGWAQRLTEAARSSIHSLSGLLIVPAVTAKER